jgi:hypothetical protein
MRETRIKPFERKALDPRFICVDPRRNEAFAFPEKPLPRIYAEDAGKAFQAENRLIRVSSAPIRVETKLLPFRKAFAADSCGRRG